MSNIPPNLEEFERLVVELETTVNQALQRSFISKSDLRDLNDSLLAMKLKVKTVIGMEGSKPLIERLVRTTHAFIHLSAQQVCNQLRPEGTLTA